MSDFSEVPDFYAQIRVLLSQYPVFLLGSSWSLVPGYAGFGEGSNLAGVVCHGCPSQAVFDALRVSGDEVYAEVDRVSNPGFINYLNGSDRNGLASSSGNSDFVSILKEFSWFDKAAGKSWTMKPFQGQGPVPYAAPGW